MTSRAEALWSTLRTAGAVDGERPATSDTPWYLAAMAGVAAWIAAVFLVGFFLTLFDDLWQTPALAFPLGAACCAFAILSLRHLSGREFFEQFAIAASLVGQVLIGLALAKWSNLAYERFGHLFGETLDEHLFCAGVGAVALTMYALDRHRMHRFLCGLIFAGALAGQCLGGAAVLERFAVPLLAWTMLALWWGAAARDRRADALAPLAWATSLVALALAWIVGPDAGSSWRFDPASDAAIVILSQLPVVPLLPACAYWLLSRQTPALSARDRLVGFALAAAFGLLWWRAPGVNIGVCLTLIGFALYRPALLGVGIVGLAVYLLRYYYQLDVPLIDKAWWLIGGGAALLVVRWGLLRVRRGEVA